MNHSPIGHGVYHNRKQIRIHGRHQFSYINNHFKLRVQLDQQKQTIRVDRKIRPIHMLSTQSSI